MAGEELKQVEEVVTETPQEVIEPTLPKVEQTLEQPKYTQKQLDEAVGKGNASMQAQITLSKAEATKLQAEKAEATSNYESLSEQLKSIREEHEKLLADDEDALKGYKDRQAQLARETQLKKREADVERKNLAAEEKTYNAMMVQKATELIEETGISLEELKGSQTPEEMEVKALRHKMTKVTDKPVETEVPTPPVDKGVSTGSIGRTFKDIEKAYARGDITGAEYREARKQELID